MAIRIRKVNGCTVALCAVEADPAPGDLYLDDNVHHALSTKFALDFNSEGLSLPLPFDAHLCEVMQTQKQHDAKEEIEKWLADAPHRSGVQ